MVEARTQREALASIELELRPAATFNSTYDFRPCRTPGPWAGAQQSVVLAAAERQGHGRFPEQVSEVSQLGRDQACQQAGLQHDFDAAGARQVRRVA